jgi:hypothetical protein
MFTMEELQKLLRARPFTAFRLHMSDGGKVDVISPESTVAGRRTAIVCFLEGDSDRWQLVYYMHVTRVEMLVSGSPPFPPPPGEQGDPTPSAV